MSMGWNPHAILLLVPRPSPSPFPSKSIATSTFRSTNSQSRAPNTIVTCFSSTKPPRKAAAQKEAAKEETERLVRVIIRNAFDERKPLLSTLNKYVKDVRTEHCFRIFEELGKRDRWLQCLEVFRWMQKQRWYVADNGIYSKLISVMGKKGQTRMAMWLFTEMRNSGCRADTSVYNALITAHLHSRDKAKALAKAYGYFEKMKGIQRCQPNIVTYNILLRAYAQARDTRQVEVLFKDLDESSISPDTYTYNGVMGAYGKNGMISEMESLLLRMKKNQCKPDAITFNILIDSYGKRQLFDKMEQVFKSLLRSKEKPTHTTFNSMIINYGKARLRDKAESIFLKMKDLGYKPSYITYESLITTYGYCDCVAKARTIFDEMIESEEEKMHVSTLNVMLEAYCLNGLPGEADKLLDLSVENGLEPNSSTYKLLYKAYTRSKSKGLLQRLLRRMDKHGIVPNRRFFLEALEEFGSSQSTQGKKGNGVNSTSSDATKKISSSASADAKTVTTS